MGSGGGGSVAWVLVRGCRGVSGHGGGDMGPMVGGNHAFVKCLVGRCRTVLYSQGANKVFFEDGLKKGVQAHLCAGCE